MEIKRRRSRAVKIGKITIGGSAPVAVQSMLKVKTSDIQGALKQIKELEGLGCEIIRAAVKDKADSIAIARLKDKTGLPIVADIHFDYRLALAAIEAGADKIRLNPGNIFKKEEIREIAGAAKQARIPIRVGVNSGSIRETSNQLPVTRNTVDRMVKSALDYVKILEGFKFHDIVLSLKASGVLGTVEAYRKIAKLCDYPLHLGVTATGACASGVVKSSIALGALLIEGIGDTIRVSLTAKPTEEVYAAKAILSSLNLRHFGPQIISCPTCGRCEVNLVKIVNDFDSKLRTMDYGLWTNPPKVAIMGCVVNGPGEAKEADIAVAFGRKDGLLFRKGKSIRKVAYNNCVEALLREVTRNQ